MGTATMVPHLLVVLIDRRIGIATIIISTKLFLSNISKVHCGSPKRIDHNNGLSSR